MLNYCTKNGINFNILYNYKDSIVSAFIEDENVYLLKKEDLREMSFTARIKGIENVTLITNYGLELNSKHEKPSTVGFDEIKKLSVQGI